MGVKAARPSDLRAMLEAWNIRPRKALGQNFLVDGNIREIILNTLAPARSEAVLEIGPGAGALTEGLLDAGCRVIAVEKDARLAALLRERFAERSGLELQEGDALETDLEAVFRDGVRRVVSNLPYATGTRILVRLLFADPGPDRIVVTLQTEVAERVTAPVGSPAYGLLALWAAWRFDGQIVRRIPATCFHPAPEVQSSILRLDRRDRPRMALRDAAHFLAFTRWAFSQRRKQVQTVLRRMPGSLGRVDGDMERWLAALGVSASSRPGDLDMVAWGRMSNRLCAPVEAGSADVVG